MSAPAPMLADTRDSTRAEQIASLLRGIEAKLGWMISTPIGNGAQDAAECLGDVREALGILRAAPEPVS